MVTFNFAAVVLVSCLYVWSRRRESTPSADTSRGALCHSAYFIKVLRQGVLISVSFMHYPKSF